MGRIIGNWRVNHIRLQYRKLQTQSPRSNPSYGVIQRKTKRIRWRHPIHQEARSSSKSVWGPLLLRPPIEGSIAKTSIEKLTPHETDFECVLLLQFRERIGACHENPGWRPLEGRIPKLVIDENDGAEFPWYIVANLRREEIKQFLVASNKKQYFDLLHWEEMARAHLLGFLQTYIVL